MTQTRIPIMVITGGSRGLGKSMVQKLAQRDTDVIFTCRSSRVEADTLATELTAQGRRAAALQLDTGKIITFPAFAEAVYGVLAWWRIKRSNYLVNSAGVGVRATVAETTGTQFDRLMNVHFKGVFFLAQILLSLMTDGGRIVNISPGLTRPTSSDYGVYAAMKGVVEVLTRYLAKELGPCGIAVSVVAPGTIKTDFGGGAVCDNASLNATVASNMALGHTGLPDDISGVAASLLPPDNRWINTQCTKASGRMFL